MMSGRFLISYSDAFLHAQSFRVSRRRTVQVQHRLYSATQLVYTATASCVVFMSEGANTEPGLQAKLGTE